MSTIIKYKGSTIATISNAVKTLQTQGKYCEDNIEITESYNPFGDQAEIIGTYSKQKFYLSNTNYNGWTPSTTAKTIVATTNLDSIAADMSNYEYFTRFIVDAKIAYASGTTKKAAPVREITQIFQYMYRKPNSFANIASVTDNANYCTTVSTVGITDYYNTSGSHTFSWSASYGFYGAAAAHTFSNSTSNTPTITIKRPALTARCNTTYFSTNMGSAVDQSNSSMEVWGWLYRCKKGSYGYSVWRDVISAYNA